MADISGQLVLAQNQHAFVQDATKGTVQVISGPHSLALSANDRPVMYDKNRDEFVSVPLGQAIKQNPLVPEGHYLILENPATDGDGALRYPKGGANSPTELRVGRKINIPGPATFPLWPGQYAQAIPGHHLRSNQYLVVRVYNAEEADKNAPEYLKTETPFTPGALLVIKGTEVSFFIPSTGFEVLKEETTGNYVREALTLERLEYAILLDEDGNKRYERGPQVVFPEATERFVTKDNTIKFKAIELNDQMGLYIKVIADYEEEIPELELSVPTGNTVTTTPPVAPGHVRRDLKTYRQFVTGEELFVTGKDQRIYYPRPEHALIGYDDPTKNFKRERYYGITIPKGEGRYVLDKEAGTINKIEGPQIFLPDPRNQVIVRRVLDDRTVNLWYPSNEEALTFNRTLRSLTEESSSYLADSVVLSAAADVSRSINRGTANNKALGADIVRTSKFTPPPMLTLSSKYDGVPVIGIWTGYAAQVINKSGDRRVVVGPASVLLEYDETLEVLELSTGKPKTTDSLKRDTYLRVDNNLISDIVKADSKDLVGMELRLSYRVNFLKEHQDKWFSVENYVKYLCDHMRSLLKAALKKHTVKEIIEDAATIIRDVVLGKKSGDGPRHHFFPENGMDVYDVEVLNVTIADQKIGQLLQAAQTRAVESTITLANDEQALINVRRATEITTEVAKIRANFEILEQELSRTVTEAKSETTMKRLESAFAEAEAEQKQTTAEAEADLSRRKNVEDHELSLEKEHVTLFEKRMASISPQLIQALNSLGETEMFTRLSVALAPLALNEQTSIGDAMTRVFRGTPMETVVSNLTKAKQ